MRTAFRVVLGVTVIAAIGCGASPELRAESDRRWIAREADAIRSDPWERSGFFAAWEFRHWTGSILVFGKPGDPTDAVRGPALLSETIPMSAGDARSLRSSADDYKTRRDGRVVRVLFEGPNTLVFEAAYTAPLGAGVPFRSIARLSRRPDTGEVAVLTFVIARDLWSDSEAAAIAASLRDTRFRPGVTTTRPASRPRL